MSFATSVKNEITNYETLKSESIAELSAFIYNNGEIKNKNIVISTENKEIAERILELIEEIYHITLLIDIKKSYNFNKNLIYILEINKKQEEILNDLSLKDNSSYLVIPKDYIMNDDEEKRAYIKGIFLACGSINDPKTSGYHLEFLVKNKEYALFLKNLLNEYNLNSKILNRIKGYMVYIKESESISDFLKLIKAYNAVMYFEDIRIYKDHINMTNRLNNCEQANIEKTINAANKQLEDINIIEKYNNLELLDNKLKEISLYRKKYPEASLIELSNIISVETNLKVSKSGLNHRFRKIKELADKIRQDNKEKI